MILLYGLLQDSAIRKYAAALKMVFPTVTANVSFLNLTVISAGIPQGTAILAATISTCL